MSEENKQTKEERKTFWEMIDRVKESAEELVEFIYEQDSGGGGSNIEDIKVCSECEYYNVMRHDAVAKFLKTDCPRCQGYDLSLSANIAARLLLDGRAEECLLMLLSMENTQGFYLDSIESGSITEDDEIVMKRHIKAGGDRVRVLRGDRWKNSSTRGEMQFSDYFDKLQSISNEAFEGEGIQDGNEEKNTETKDD